MSLKKGDEYSCKQVPIIINVPDNTVKVEIIATVLDDDDKFLNLSSKLKVSEIMDARIGAEYWENENVKYVLTDKSKAELEDREAINE